MAKKKTAPQLAPDDVTGIMLWDDVERIDFSFWETDAPPFENYVELRKSDKKRTLLTVGEIKRAYNFDQSVAEKIYQYQMGYLEEFYESLDKLSARRNAYLRVKKYKTDNKYDNDILAQYVSFSGADKQFLREFHPLRNLSINLLLAVLSLSLYAFVILFGVQITSWNDWFSAVAVGLVSLIWLAITLTAVVGVRKEYITRKLVSNLGNPDGSES